MKKIDVHCHTTNRRVEGLFCQYPTLSAIESEMKKYDVEKTVVLATYFPHKGTGVSNFRLHNWVRDNKNFEMFGSLDFDHFYLQGLNELTEMAENKMMKGIKIYTCYQHIDLGSEKLGNVLNLAEQYELPVMFHVGYSYSCMSKCGKVAYTEPVSPKNLELLALNHPNLNFIFSHMGKPFFGELVDVARNLLNVYTDSSGLVDFNDGSEEIEKTVLEVREFLEKCGSDKLLFGTDFPVQTHEHSVYLIEQAMKDFSQKDKEKVYSENARRLLKL